MGLIKDSKISFYFIFHVGMCKAQHDNYQAELSLKNYLTGSL